MSEEKKPFFKRKWFIVLAIVIVIGAINSIASEEDSSKEKQQAKSSEAQNQDDEIVGEIGKPFNVGDVEYTVNSVDKTSSVGNSYLSKKADGIFIVVEISIKI